MDYFQWAENNLDVSTPHDLQYRGVQLIAIRQAQAAGSRFGPFDVRSGPHPEAPAKAEGTQSDFLMHRSASSAVLAGSVFLDFHLFALVPSILCLNFCFCSGLI